MYIKIFKIKNFKSFEEVVFHFNPDLNILTGINNSGKTSVLEALALWVECFERLIWQVKSKTSKRAKLGEYLLQGDQAKNATDSLYLSFQEIISVRTAEYGDIFNLKTQKNIELRATLENSDGLSLEIPFEIKRGAGLMYTIKMVDNHFDYALFNRFFTKFPLPIQSYFATPIANISQIEKFETNPNLEYAITQRQTSSVMRNRLYKLAKDSVSYQEFLSKLNQIINNNTEKIDIQLHNNERVDREVKATLNIGANDLEKNIALMGSGCLQIIEILLNFYNEKKDLNLILLDEPDSHIHRSVQQRLLQVLVEYGTDSQIFITTHNEHLIRSAQYQHVFHLDAKPVNEYYNITHSAQVKERIGLQPSWYRPIIQTLSETPTALDFVSALECDKLVFAEGDDDARFLQAIWDKKINNKTRYMYWALGGVSKIYMRIGAYKDIFSLIKNKTTLWQKSCLVFDRDALTDEMRQELLEKMKQKLQIPVYIWNSYTIESVLLSDTEKLSALLKRFIAKKGGDIFSISIDEKLNEAMTELVQNIKDRYWDINGDINTKLTYDIGKRVQKDLLHIKEQIGISLSNFDNHTRIVQAIEAHIKSALLVKNIHKLAKKEDAEFVINQVFSYFSFPFSQNDFIELIRFSNLSEDFEDWKELLKL